MEGYARVPETGITRKMNAESEFVDLLGVDWDRFQEFSLKFRRTDGYIWEDCLRLDEYWKGNNEKSGRRVWERVMFISSLKFGYMEERWVYRNIVCVWISIYGRRMIIF